MENDTLDLLVILDRSGSMQDAKKDHEGGLRSFIKEQRELEGDVRLTFVQFDTHNPCEIIYDRTPLEEVKDEDIVLVPRGGTPLLHAIGAAVSHLRDKLKRAKSRVVTMVITDGEENESHRTGPEWTKTRVRALKDELEQAGWTFLFLGANVDAFAEAATLGVASAFALGYTNAGPQVAAAYGATSANLRSARGQHVNSVRRVASMGLTGQSLTDASDLEWKNVVSSTMSYSDDQRVAASGKSPFPSGASTDVVTPLNPNDAQANDVTVTTTTTTADKE